MRIWLVKKDKTLYIVSDKPLVIGDPYLMISKYHPKEVITNYPCDFRKVEWYYGKRPPDKVRVLLNDFVVT